MARVLVSSGEMSGRSLITFTSIRTKRLFAHIGSNTRLLMASQASEAIETQCMMADLLGSSSNQLLCLWCYGYTSGSYRIIQ